MGDSDMDNESLMLALKIQLEDLELCERSKKGKQLEGEVLDSDVALEACRHDLEEMATLASDHALCLSIAQALDMDAALIAEVQTEEEQAAQDREFALRLSRNPSATPTAASTKINKAEQPVEDLKDPWHDSDEHQNQGESSRSGASRQYPETGECIACTERFRISTLTRSTCSYHYCRECLIGLVSSSLHDESLFPPRCCGKDIPIETGPWFSPTLMGQFQAKKLEFDTPNRTYCSEPSCSTFVPPAFIKEEVARCPKCSQTTCVHYKERLTKESVPATARHSKSWSLRLGRAGSSATPARGLLS